MEDENTYKAAWAFHVSQIHVTGLHISRPSRENDLKRLEKDKACIGAKPSYTSSSPIITSY